MYLKIFIILLPILTLFRGYEVLARVKDYFVIVYAFLIFDLCSLKHFSKNYRKYLTYIVIIFFCFAGYIRTLFVFDNGLLRKRCNHNIFANTVPFHEPFDFLHGS